MLTVVTGPPCAGKTTYVRQNAGLGDIVIDFDEIAQALGCRQRHHYGDHTWHVTLAARNAAITEAISRHHLGAMVWIIDCVIPAHRRRIYEMAGACITELGAAPAELHRRADAERPPEWHQRIENWLATRGRSTTAGAPAPAAEPGPRTGTRW